MHQVSRLPGLCPHQVNIQIDQATDPMRITVAGQPHTVDTAAAAVSEIINGGNPFGAGGPASLGGACAATPGGDGRQSPRP